jgi:hypothetical protein
LTVPKVSVHVVRIISQSPSLDLKLQCCAEWRESESEEQNWKAELGNLSDECEVSIFISENGSPKSS